MSIKTLDIKKAPGIDYIGDAKAMKFDDNTFDTILSFQTLEHIDDSDKVVSEIFRCLKKGGRCIVTVPFLIPQHADPRDFYRYTKIGIETLFKKNGFKIVELGSYGGIFGVIEEFLKFLFLNPYKRPYSRIRCKLVGFVLDFCFYLDTLKIFQLKDFYANVYIVVEK